MLELLFKDLQQIKAIRKEAIEFSGMKFRGQGLKFIDGKPIWIQNGKPYYIFLLMKLSGRFMQHPAILNEISNIIARIVDFSKVDKILTLETMGIHISTALSLRTKKPLAIAGKIKYYDEVTSWEPPHQIEVTKKTGYGVSKLYINDIFPEDKVMIFDSIISTGGSFTSLIKRLKERRIEIVDAVAVLEKGFESLSTVILAFISSVTRSSNPLNTTIGANILLMHFSSSSTTHSPFFEESLYSTKMSKIPALPVG